MSKLLKEYYPIATYATELVYTLWSRPDSVRVTAWHRWRHCHNSNRGACIWPVVRRCWTSACDSECLKYTRVFFGVGLFVLPLALISSFPIGMYFWRTQYPDDNQQLHGALFGGLTAVCSLAIGAFGPAMFLTSTAAVRGDMVLLEAIAFGLFLVPVGFLMAIVAAGWLVIPIGIVGGWYHERAKATST